MTSPELEDESVGIIRTIEPSREGLVEVSLILLIHVAAISCANSPPACRIDSDAAYRVYRIL